MSFVPAYSRPARNRRVLLIKRPAGIPQANDFALDEVAIEAVPDGKFLVRNIYLSVDPAQRGWVNEDKNYSAPVPIGGVMRALAVGEIVESRHKDFKTGSYVYGWLGWQDYSVIGPEAVVTLFAEPAAPLSAYAGVLGINGLTAQIAFAKLGRPVAGDTVLVSTAAGAVGSLVGQLARRAGCRTIGLTGDAEKVAKCQSRFGYDVAINYRDAGYTAAVDAAAPDGLDIYFDNVGGVILDAMLRKMRSAGRIIQCGTASIAAWTPPPSGPRNEREILTRRVIWSGFVVFDHVADYGAAIADLAALIRNGELHYDEDIAAGIEAAPDAIRRLYAGENQGKQLIFVG